jgi:hypothetical protein
MDRAKFSEVAPPRETAAADREDGESKHRKNFRKKGKTPSGRSGKAVVHTHRKSRRRG